MIGQSRLVLTILLLVVLSTVPAPGGASTLPDGTTPNATPGEGHAGPGHGFTLPPGGVAGLSRYAPEMVDPALPDDDQASPSPVLVHRLHRDLLTRIRTNSSDPAAIDRFMATRLLPPPVWSGGLPSKGSPRALVILVDFPDSPALPSQTVADVSSKMFGDGGYSPDAPKENLRRYYQRSSFNQLDLCGDVYGWYHSPYTREEYLDLAAAYQQLYGDVYGPRIGIACARSDLLFDALSAIDPQVDLSRYDNNHDGTIDAVFLKYAGEPGEWASLFWASQARYAWNEGIFDGVRPNKYVFSWYASQSRDTSYPLYRPSTDIHETGHLLGLPDYYDYDPTVGPRGGVGGMDMMDANWGDHNVFSKYLLGWVTPTIVSSGSWILDLRPASAGRDAVIVMPDASLDQYAEFFMVEYRVPGTGVVPTTIPVPAGSYYTLGPYNVNGLMLWHVDARLDGTRTGFAFDNSYTPHKLLRLMEADGREHLEHQQGTIDGNFDLADLYTAGSSLGPSTVPSSANYAGEATGVTVRPLALTATIARVGIGTVGGPARVPGGVSLPGDLDGDGQYEDVNGNGRTDFADVVLLFNQLDWVAANEPVEAFDFNQNGRTDFGDVVRLFGLV